MEVPADDIGHLQEEIAVCYGVAEVRRRGHDAGSEGINIGPRPLTGVWPCRYRWWCRGRKGRGSQPARENEQNTGEHRCREAIG